MTRGRPPLLGIAFALALALGGCGAGEEQLFGDYPSPDGEYSLRVTVAEPRAPQGLPYVRLYLRQDGVARELVETRLASDGVPFTSRNIAVRWVTPRQVLVCLRATDRPDRGYRVDVAEPPRVEEVAKC